MDSLSAIQHYYIKKLQNCKVFTWHSKFITLQSFSYLLMLHKINNYFEIICQLFKSMKRLYLWSEAPGFFCITNKAEFEIIGFCSI